MPVGELREDAPREVVPGVARHVPGREHGGRQALDVAVLVAGDRPDVVGGEHPRAAARRRRPRGRGRAATSRPRRRRRAAPSSRAKHALEVRRRRCRRRARSPGRARGPRSSPARRPSPGPLAREVAGDDHGRARRSPADGGPAAARGRGRRGASRRQPSSTASGSQSKSSCGAGSASSSVSLLGQQVHERVASHRGRVRRRGRPRPPGRAPRAAGQTRAASSASSAPSRDERRERRRRWIHGLRLHGTAWRDPRWCRLPERRYGQGERRIAMPHGTPGHASPRRRGDAAGLARPRAVAGRPRPGDVHRPMASPSRQCEPPRAARRTSLCSVLTPARDFAAAGIDGAGEPEATTDGSARLLRLRRRVGGDRRHRARRLPHTDEASAKETYATVAAEGLRARRRAGRVVSTSRSFADRRRGRCTSPSARAPRPRARGAQRHATPRPARDAGAARDRAGRQRATAGSIGRCRWIGRRIAQRRTHEPSSASSPASGSGRPSSTATSCYLAGQTSDARRRRRLRADASTSSPGSTPSSPPPAADKSEAADGQHLARGHRHVRRDEPGLGRVGGSGNMPARATVEARLAAPEYKVEIAVIAAR